MKTLTSESYNIAWFKLADFVARGEKERALSVLRLLMHSISDEALTYQLEGDILRAFQDFSAIDRYLTAAQLYQKLGKLQQAISSHQHAITLQENEKTLQALLQMYLNLEHKTGTTSSFSKLAHYLISKHNSDYVIIFTHDLTITLPLHLQSLIYAQLSISLLLHDHHHQQISNIVEKTINLLQQNLTTQNASASDLQKFLADLKALNYKEYKNIEKSLKEYL